MDFMCRHLEIEANLKADVNRKKNYTKVKQEYSPAWNEPIGKNVFQGNDISTNLQTISGVNGVMENAVCRRDRFRPAQIYFIRMCENKITLSHKIKIRNILIINKKAPRNPGSCVKMKYQISLLRVILSPCRKAFSQPQLSAVCRVL